MISMKEREDRDRVDKKKELRRRKKQQNRERSQSLLRRPLSYWNRRRFFVLWLLRLPSSDSITSSDTCAYRTEIFFHRFFFCRCVIEQSSLTGYVSTHHHHHIIQTNIPQLSGNLDSIFSTVFFCLFLLSICSSLTFAMSDELSSSEKGGFDKTHLADFTLIFFPIWWLYEKTIIHVGDGWRFHSNSKISWSLFVRGGEFSHFVLISTHFYFSYVSLESQIVLGIYHSIAGKNSNIFEKKNCVTLTINLFHSEKCFFWSRIIWFFFTTSVHTSQTYNSY